MYFGSIRRAATRSGVLFVLFALCALGASQTMAQQAALPSYDVELVIFQHLGGGATEEVWNLEPTTDAPIGVDDDVSPFDAVPSDASNAPTQTFPPLPATKFRLTAIEDQLRRSRNYRPLAHIGWTQPGYARNAAPFIPLSSLVPEASGLSGRLSLSRGRYLHLTLDLTLAQDGERYVLRHTRRMRSTERHYIDHPKFGVIALITPTATNTP